MTIPVTRYAAKIWRIISSRCPPTEVFKAVAPAEDFEALYQLESRTNDRLRQANGNLASIMPDEAVNGPGSGYVMAAFTHLNPEGSRFSDGSYGVYYAARELKTAVEETKYHRTRFLRRTREKPQSFDMRVLTAVADGLFQDISGCMRTLPALYDPEDYGASQGWAKPLYRQGAEGIVYDSVRYSGGLCFAVFKPRLLARCQQAQHLKYVWNGDAISDVLEIRQVA